MAREVNARDEINAAEHASQLVRQHGRRNAEVIAWEQCDRARAASNQANYDTWQAVIRHISNRTESPHIDDETRAAFGHGGPVAMLVDDDG